MRYYFQSKMQANGHTFLFGCDIRSSERMYEAFYELTDEVPEFTSREAMIMVNRLTDVLYEYERKVKKGDAKLLQDIADAPNTDDDDYDEQADLDEWWEEQQ